MKAGDLVKISRFTRWGGRIDTDMSGILVKRTYLSYESKYSKWDILMSDNKIANLPEKNLKTIE